MAAHRWWGLMILARPGSGNGVGLAEVELRASAGGADQCTSGTASGNSSFGHVAGQAFDDSASTIWHNAATGGERVRLSYEFPSAVTVAEVFMRLPGAGSAYPGATYGPSGVWIQWSDDGSTWYYGTGAADLSTYGNDDTYTLGVTDVLPSARITLAGGDWSAFAPAPFTPRWAAVSARHDHEDGGPLRIAGTTRIDGTPPTPVGRRVRLFHEASGRLVREVWSDPVTGAFAFERLRSTRYLVVTADHTALYDPVARDRVVPVP